MPQVRIQGRPLFPLVQYLAAALCLSVPSVDASSAESAYDTFNKAGEAVRAGRYKEAVPLFQAALADASFAAERPEAFYWAGQAAVLAKDAGGAGLLEKALDRCGDVEIRARARYWLAQARLDSGDATGALSALDSGPVSRQYLRRADLLRVRALTKTGDPAKLPPALLAVLPAYWLDRDMADVIPDAAARIKEKSGVAQMLEVLKVLVEKGGPSVRSVAGKIGAFEAAQIGDSDKLALFLASLGAGSETQAAAVKAAAMLNAGDAAGAESALASLPLEKCKDEHVLSFARRVLAEACLRQGRLREALNVIAAAGAEEWAPGILRRVAQQAALTGQWPLALEASRMPCLSKASIEDTADVRYLEAWALMKTGDKGSAATSFLQFVEQFREHGNAAEALVMAAECLSATGKEAEAQEALRLLRKLYPSSPYARASRGCSASQGSEPAAVDVENLAGDEGGKVGDKKEYR